MQRCRCRGIKPQPLHKHKIHATKTDERGSKTVDVHIVLHFVIQVTEIVPELEKVSPSVHHNILTQIRVMCEKAAKELGGIVHIVDAPSFANTVHTQLRVA